MPAIEHHRPKREENKQTIVSDSKVMTRSGRSAQT
jgi:hypothetical protein